jgi:uncharacterized membrane protein
MLSSLTEFLATLTGGLFTGAAVYVTLVEHPARVSCGSALAISEFRPSYKRAAVMQATLALVGAAAALVRWGVSGGRGWLVGGLLLGAVIPFTVCVIGPTNKRLFEGSLDLNSPESANLLTRWGRLHTVRSAVSLGAFLIFVFLLVR